MKKATGFKWPRKPAFMKKKFKKGKGKWLKTPKKVAIKKGFLKRFKGKGKLVKKRERKAHVVEQVVMVRVI